MPPARLSDTRDDGVGKNTLDFRPWRSVAREQVEDGEVNDGAL